MHQQSYALFLVSTATFPRREGISHQSIADLHGALGCCHGNIQCECELHYLPSSLPVADLLWQVMVTLHLHTFKGYYV